MSEVIDKKVVGLYICYVILDLSFISLTSFVNYEAVSKCLSCFLLYSLNYSILLPLSCIFFTSFDI